MSPKRNSPPMGPLARARYLARKMPLRSMKTDPPWGCRGEPEISEGGHPLSNGEQPQGQDLPSMIVGGANA